MQKKQGLSPPLLFSFLRPPCLLYAQIIIEWDHVPRGWSWYQHNNCGEVHSSTVARCTVQYSTCILCHRILLIVDDSTTHVGYKDSIIHTSGFSWVKSWRGRFPKVLNDVIWMEWRKIQQFYRMMMMICQSNNFGILFSLLCSTRSTQHAENAASIHMHSFNASKVLDTYTILYQPRHASHCCLTSPYTACCSGSS